MVEIKAANSTIAQYIDRLEQSVAQRLGKHEIAFFNLSEIFDNSAILNSVLKLPLHPDLKATLAYVYAPKGRPFG